MKIKIILSIILICLGCCEIIYAQSTEFSYQGSINNSGSPANGNFDFQFLLFDGFTGGVQIGSTLSRNALAVANGVFSVNLDFGGSFPGANRFLEVRVRQTGGGGFTTLSPRQSVASAPYSIKSLSAENATTAANSQQLGGIAANQYVLTGDVRLSDSRNPLPNSSNYVQNNTTLQNSSNFNISGTGTANVFNAGTQFNIGGNRVFAVPSLENTFAGINAGAGSTNTVGNTFFGHSAGQNNSTQGQNSFFGSKAGQNTNGNANSFFGHVAGQLNVSGSSNSFFGAGSGDVNTASDNSFFGASSGGANTTGTRNSFFGKFAGQMNVTGGENSFFGFEAGRNTTVSFNSFFGSRAGQANTIGSSNSFFGTAAGSVNSEGNDNSFFGVNTGVLNTFGSGNSFFGRRAGRDNITGLNNTFVGIDAGRNNILGDNNTVIGAGADVRGSGLHFATAIGAGASVSEDDTIEIGRSADKVLIRGNVLTSLGFYFAGLSDAGDVHACVANSNLPSPPIYKYVGICVSSIKYKTNVLPLRSGLDLIRKLQPVTYNWKASGTAAIGLIAEEVFTVDPILTVPDEMGEPRSVKYDSVTVVLVNAVNEQQSQIEAQSARLKALETQNRVQRDMIQAQQKQIDELVKLICTNVADGGQCKVAIPPK